MSEYSSGLISGFFEIEATDGSHAHLHVRDPLDVRARHEADVSDVGDMVVDGEQLKGILMSVPADAYEPTRPHRRRGASKREDTGVAEGEPPISFLEDRPRDAILRLVRTTWGGLVVSFRVELDGFFVAELAYGATLDIPVDPGEHILAISGGGAFLGVKERFFVEESELTVFTVCYSWYGGIALSRVRE